MAEEFQVIVSTNEDFETKLETHTCCGLRLLKNRAMTASQLNIILGLCCMALNLGIAVMDTNRLWVIGSGWWAGILIILAGLFSHASLDLDNPCNVAGTMVSSLLAVISTCLLIFHSTSVILVDILCPENVSNVSLVYCLRTDGAARVSNITFAAFMMASGIMSLISTLYAASFCWRITWYRV